MKGEDIHPLAQVLGLAFEFDEILQGGEDEEGLPEKEALVKIMKLEDRQFSKELIHGLLLAFQNDSLFDQDDRFFELPL